MKCNLDSCLFQPVPYTGDIPGGLASKRTITIRGFIPKNASRFGGLSFFLQGSSLGLTQQNASVKACHRPFPVDLLSLTVSSPLHIRRVSPENKEVKGNGSKFHM